MAMEDAGRAAGIGAVGGAIAVGVRATWRFLRGAVKLQEVAEAVPQLQDEFREHCDEDRQRHAEVQHAIDALGGDVKVALAHLEWLRRAHEKGSE